VPTVEQRGLAVLPAAIALGAGEPDHVGSVLGEGDVGAGHLRPRPRAARSGASARAQARRIPWSRVCIFWRAKKKIVTRIMVYRRRLRRRYDPASVTKLGLMRSRPSRPGPRPCRASPRASV